MEREEQDDGSYLFLIGMFPIGQYVKKAVIGMAKQAIYVKWFDNFWRHLKLYKIDQFFRNVSGYFIKSTEKINIRLFINKRKGL